MPNRLRAGHDFGAASSVVIRNELLAAGLKASGAYGGGAQGTCWGGSVRQHGLLAGPNYGLVTSP